MHKEEESDGGVGLPSGLFQQFITFSFVLFHPLISHSDIFWLSFQLSTNVCFLIFLDLFAFISALSGIVYFPTF